MSEPSTMLLPRVGSDPPPWLTIDRDLPPKDFRVNGLLTSAVVHCHVLLPAGVAKANGRPVGVSAVFCR